MHTRKHARTHRHTCTSTHTRTHTHTHTHNTHTQIDRQTETSSSRKDVVVALLYVTGIVEGLVPDGDAGEGGGADADVVLH